MSTPFQVEVVSVEERLWSGEATFLIAQTTEGELGIHARHEHLFGKLVEGGAIAVDPVEGPRLAAAIQGGFLSVTGDKVTVLAEQAQWATNLDAAAVSAALESAADGSSAQVVARGQQRALSYIAGS